MNILKILEVRKLSNELNTIITEIKTQYYQNLSANNIYSVSSKLRGALRRKSMDLTRALAEMRKPT